MTRIEEPTRWSDAGSPVPDGLRKILRDGRAALGPTDAQVDGVGAHLAGLLAPGAPPPPALSPVRAIAHAVTKSAALKVVAIAALGSGAVVGGWRLAPTHGPHASPIVTAAPPESATRPSPLRVAGAASVAASDSSVGGSGSAADPSSPVTNVASTPRTAATSDLAPSTSAPRRNTTVGSTATHRAPKNDTSTAQLANDTSSIAPPTNDTSSPAPPPPTELELLDRARRLVGIRPDEALAAIREHDRRYPNGQFEQESAVLAIEALVHAGRTSEARERAAAFDSRFPQSAHRRRIAVLLGDPP